MTAMRYVTLGLLLMGLLVTGSCGKPPTYEPGGTWSFKGVTNIARYCVGNGSSAILTATDSTYSGVAGSLNIVFYNVLPVGNGTYTVVKGSYPSRPDQVAIVSYIGPSIQGVSYQSTGGNGLETVYVSLTNGKMNLTSSQIEMSDTSNPGDSASLTFKLTQLQ